MRKIKDTFQLQLCYMGVLMDTKCAYAHTHTSAIQVHTEHVQGPREKTLQESNHFDQDENIISK